MKVELAHDIIALKIWEKLPERDRTLLRVKKLLKQRVEEHEKGKGSLLGEKEIHAWEGALKVLVLEEEEKKFIKLSKEQLEKEKNLKIEQEQKELSLTKAKLVAEQKANKEQQDKLYIEQKARKRQRRYLGLIGIALLAVIGFYLTALSEKTKVERTAKNLEYFIEQLAIEKSKDSFESIHKLKKKYNYKEIYLIASELKEDLKNFKESINNSSTLNFNVEKNNKENILNIQNIKTDSIIKENESLVHSGYVEKFTASLISIDSALAINDFQVAQKHLNELKTSNKDYYGIVTEKEQQIKSARLQFQKETSKINLGVNFEESDNLVKLHFSIAGINNTSKMIYGSTILIIFQMVMTLMDNL